MESDDEVHEEFHDVVEFKRTFSDGATRAWAVGFRGFADGAMYITDEDGDNMAFLTWEAAEKLAVMILTRAANRAQRRQLELIYPDA